MRPGYEEQYLHCLDHWPLGVSSLGLVCRVSQNKEPFWNFRPTNPYDYSGPLWTVVSRNVLGQLDKLDSYGLLNYFIQFCLFGWFVIVTWICEPEISERYSFSGTPCVIRHLVKQAQAIKALPQRRWNREASQDSLNMLFIHHTLFKSCKSVLSLLWYPQDYYEGQGRMID